MTTELNETKFVRPSLQQPLAATRSKPSTHFVRLDIHAGLLEREHWTCGALESGKQQQFFVPSLTEIGINN